MRRFRYRLARALLRQAFFVLRLGRSYEPIALGDYRRGGTRETDARWGAIAEVIRTTGATSLLDIGCAEGWLVRRAATDTHCFAIGVEAGERMLVGEIGCLHDEVERMALVRARVGPDDIRALPVFDIVVCLSVVHHVFRFEGVAGAEAFVRALRSRTRKALIFEMGTADERKFSFASSLPDMPEGQEAFISSFLSTCGLTNVRVIGETMRYSGTTRLLFCAEPGEPA